MTRVQLTVRVDTSTSKFNGRRCCLSQLKLIAVPRLRVNFWKKRISILKTKLTVSSHAVSHMLIGVKNSV